MGGIAEMQFTCEKTSGTISFANSAMSSTITDTLGISIDFSEVTSSCGDLQLTSSGIHNRTVYYTVEVLTNGDCTWYED
jgi:hypothetical protein